ncbi:MAG: alkaline phosphatase, partial [Bacteroidota bacterium]
MRILLLLLTAALFACTPKAAIIPNDVPPAYDNNVAPKKEPIQKPKNIILLIGDGMGLTQITAAMYRNGNRLNLERFPIVGLHKSHSSSALITDSAAGATAFASGVKT